MTALVVPVMTNFKGFTELIRSVDISITPYIWNNWDKNDGVTIPWNRMIVRAIQDGHRHIFVANDDTTFATDTMQKMIDVLDEREYDLVTPINMRDSEVESERRLIPHPDYASFAITSSTIDKFGLFDEELFAYYNDNDYSRNLIVNGGKYCAITDAGFYHVGSVTQLKGRDETTNDRVVSHADFEMAQGYYLAKWGGMPGNEKYTTPFGR